MIAAGPDLLIVGGLTIDRVADDSTLAGGSVLHAARAVAATGRRVATITAAGPEPEALAALAELAALGSCRVTHVASSIRFAIDQDGGRRRLVLEAAGGTLSAARREFVAVGAHAVLLAPIAGELSADSVRASAAVPVRIAALQGWLRHLVPGDEASALPLTSLGDGLSAALGELDALVASDEDLVAVAPNPRAQLAALRADLGPRPMLAVTTGADGAWLDDAASGTRHLRAARRLDAGSTIGAGDAFAGLLAVGLGARLDPIRAAMEAMAGTVDYLATPR